MTANQWRLTCIPVGPLLMNSYLLESPAEGEALLIDPGDEPERLIAAVEAGGCELRGLLCTHGHFDHVAAAAAVQKRWDLPLLHHPADAELLAGMNEHQAMFGLPPTPMPRLEPGLDPGEPIRFAGAEIAVRHVPGHSPGHVMFLWEGTALVGDLVFAGSVGRTDLPGGDFDTLARSIRESVYTLPDATVLHPGHGPSTTVGAERRSNPFVAGS